MALVIVDSNAENRSMMKKLMHMIVNSLTFIQNLKGNLKGNEKNEF